MAKMSSRGGEPWALQKAKREVTKDVRAATIAEVREWVRAEKDKLVSKGRPTDPYTQGAIQSFWDVITYCNFVEKEED